MDKRNYGCAMLAGGKGRRMGGTNKAKLEYEGGTFASKVAHELESTGLPCYISTASYEQDVPEGWTVVKDEFTDEKGGYIGPMGGIYSCLAQAEKNGLGGLFFAPCDAPLYKVDVIDTLNTIVNENGDSANAVCFRTADGRVQTTFGWYSVRMIPAMKRDMEQGHYKLAKYLDENGCIIAGAIDHDIDETVFRNINSLEEYAELVKEK